MRLLFSLALSLMGLVAQPPAVRDLFPPRPTCRMPAKDVRVGRTEYQVIFDPKTGRELFRIHIGRLDDGKWLKLWNYHIQNCGDFNRDGVLDYSWYGGDDTTSEHFLILSTPAGYRTVDITSTFMREWVRQRGGNEPELDRVGNDYYLRSISIRWAPDKLRLLAVIVTHGPGKPIRMEAEEQHWVELRH